MINYINTIGIWCAITVAVLAAFHLYNCIWVYVGTSEVFRILGAYLVLAVIGVAFQIYGVTLPRSSCIIGLLLGCFFTIGIRFSYRLSNRKKASAVENISIRTTSRNQSGFVTGIE